jgi:cyclic pyranopterin phosphate synthase
MPEGADLTYLLQQQRLTTQELLTLIEQVFILVGFTRFRLTGGEPLLHPDVVALTQAIARFPETQDLSLTTNGFLLSKLAQDLYDAGLRRINISLDSLNEQTFMQMTGNRRACWQQVWDGIQGRSLLRHTVEAAIESLCHPILVVLGAYADQGKRKKKC